jgi:hypothetical protein
MFDSAAHISLYHSFHPFLPPIDQTTIEMFFTFFKKRKCGASSTPPAASSFPFRCYAFVDA